MAVSSTTDIETTYCWWNQRTVRPKAVVVTYQSVLFSLQHIRNALRPCILMVSLTVKCFLYSRLMMQGRDMLERLAERDSPSWSFIKAHERSWSQSQLTLVMRQISIPVPGYRDKQYLHSSFVWSEGDSHWGGAQKANSGAIKDVIGS